MSEEYMNSAENESPATPVPMAPGALSPSKIATLSCPHRYNQLYVLGNRPAGPEGQALALGSLVHEVAACYARHLRDEKRNVDLNALQQYATAAWNLRPETVPVECWKEYELFIRQLGRVEIDGKAIVQAEYGMAFDLDWKPVDWSSDDVAYGGIIDLLMLSENEDGPYAHAIDWTTAAVSGVFGAKKDLQLRIYALYIAKLTGVARVWIETISLRTGARLGLMLGPDDHDATEKRMKEERARLVRLLHANNEWPAVPGVECGLCTLACPLAMQIQTEAPLRIIGPEHALDVLGRYILLEKTRKDYARVLKAYTGIHGAVELNGLAYGPFGAPTRTYGTADVLRVLKQYGIDPAEFLVVDKRKLGKLAKIDAMASASMEAIAKKTVRESFSLKSVGLPEDEGEEE